MICELDDVEPRANPTPRMREVEPPPLPGAVAPGLDPLITKSEYATAAGRRLLSRCDAAGAVC